MPTWTQKSGAERQKERLVLKRIESDQRVDDVLKASEVVEALHSSSFYRAEHFTPSKVADIQQEQWGLKLLVLRKATNDCRGRSTKAK